MVLGGRALISEKCNFFCTKTILKDTERKKTIVGQKNGHYNCYFIISLVEDRYFLPNCYTKKGHGICELQTL